MSTATPASSGVRARSRERVAVWAAASLVALGLAGASRYAGGASPAPGTVHHADGADAARGGSRPRETRLAQDGQSWPLSLFESLFGAPQRSEPARQRRPRMRRRSPQREPERASPRGQDHHQREGRPGDTATYRTVCVRLCDGYYWPISFAAEKRNFGRDSKTCRKSCNSAAALYYYPNPGGEPEDMVSLEGLPYASLGKAFAYRATYDPSCKCRPHPWETEAIERHRTYAQAKHRRAAAQGKKRRRRR